MREHWSPEDLPWNEFDATKVNPEIAQLIRTAALVEYGGNEYANYLSNVFADDAEFLDVVKRWASEEVQHGEVLARWAKLADPTFDLAEKYKAFRKGFSIDENASASIRGSRTGELIARCMVETGTSSYYTALAEATEEPVLKAICLRIAADELAHYKLFYTHFQRHQKLDALGRWQRVKIGLSRIAESDDDELSYAYYAANVEGVSDEKYDRARMSAAYLSRAYAYYKPRHIERAVGMVLKACGLNPQAFWRGLVDKLAWWAISRQHRKLQGQAA